MIISKEEKAEVLTKIEKLMAHTKLGDNGAVNVNEMAIANKLVKELMDKYSISIDEIKATPDKSKFVIKVKSETIDQKGVRHWVISLAGMIGQFYECKVIRDRNLMYFVGFDMDAQVATKMFDNLYTQIYDGATIATEIPIQYISRKTRVIDFCVGAISSLRIRLEEIISERQYQESKNALVIIKKDVVNNEYEKMYPTAENLRNKVRYHETDDYIKGKEFGKTIEIHKPIGGNQNLYIL